MNLEKKCFNFIKCLLFSLSLKLQTYLFQSYVDPSGINQIFGQEWFGGSKLLQEPVKTKDEGCRHPGCHCQASSINTVRMEKSEIIYFKENVTRFYNLVYVEYYQYFKINKPKIK